MGIEQKKDIITFYEHNKDAKMIFIKDIEEKEIDFLFNYCFDNNIKVSITEDEINRDIINKAGLSAEALGFNIDPSENEEIALTITNIITAPELQIDIYSFNPEEFYDQRMTVKEFIRAYKKYKKGNFIIIDTTDEETDDEYEFIQF